MLALNNRWRLPLFALLTFIALAGCSPLIQSEQPAHDNLLVLESGKSIGQTFSTRFSGLDGIAIYMEPGSPGDGSLILHLRADPQDRQDLAEASLPLKGVTSARFYRFQFTPQSLGHNQAGYLLLEMNGSGSVRAGTAPGNTYLNGALYVDDTPQDRQLAFRLAYNRTHLLMGLLGEGATWLLWLVEGVFLLVIPGWALLSLLWPGWKRLGWAEKLGLAGGTSLALYPLLLLWTDLVGWHWGAAYAWLPPLAGLGVLAWQNREVLAKWRFTAPSPPAKTGATENNPWSSFSAWLPEISFGILAVLIFATRFWAIRNLDAPMWGDSYQHTMIAQLLFDHGGLFHSWEPYVPYGSLTVQYGFPTYAALLMWLTGLNSLKATLIVGQLVNGLAVLALYPLATRLAGGQRWAGMGAVLVAGLLSPMPAFYVNWGRYAQLAGQAVLPAALWLLWGALEDQAPEETAQRPASRIFGISPLVMRRISLAGMVLAGMVLAYYRMPFYYATFVLVWLLGRGLPQWRLNTRRWVSGFEQMAIIGVISFLLFAPWALQLQGSHLANLVSSGVTGGSKFEGILADMQIWRDVAFYTPVSLLVIAGISALWALFNKQWLTAMLPLWVLFLVLYEIGQVIRLPGANMMQNFAILISVYIPLGLLIGWLVGHIAEIFERYGQQTAQFGMALTFLALAFWSAVSQRAIVQMDTYAIVTHPDIKAMDWIQQNIPKEAQVLVEGFRIYDGRSAVGSDGGWWMPLLARRTNTMPPQYALLNETPVNAGYSKKVVQLVSDLEDSSPASPQGIQMLCKWGITHAYIGQRQGKAGIGATQLFSPDELSSSPAFHLVYHQDLVYLFALDPQACENSR